MKRYFTVYFWFVTWTDLSLGINIDFKNLFIELHVPFGFLHIGMEEVRHKSLNWNDISWRRKTLFRKQRFIES
jgi:hypothetical protein